jgi:hypothetical protein
MRCEIWILMDLNDRPELMPIWAEKNRPQTCGFSSDRAVQWVLRSTFSRFLWQFLRFINGLPSSKPWSWSSWLFITPQMALCEESKNRGTDPRTFSPLPFVPRSHSSLDRNWRCRTRLASPDLSSVWSYLFSQNYVPIGEEREERRIMVNPCLSEYSIPDITN